MAATAEKKYSGQSGERRSTSNRQDEPYIVTGAADVGEAITAALAAASAASEDTIVVDGETLYLAGVGFDFISQSADGTLKNYEVTLRYGPVTFTRLDVGSVRVSYDTTGGTVHTSLAQSETVYAASGTPPSYDKVIGVQEDSVDGTDVPAPVFRMTVTVVVDPALTAGTTGAAPSASDVFALTGKYNAANFSVKDSVTNEVYSFLAGEVTFLGTRHPDPRSDGKVELVHTFEASPNLTNITIGDITGINKKGGQYIWVRFKDDRRGTGVNRVTARKPVHVIVNDVTANGDSASGDFTLLNIPIPP